MGFLRSDKALQVTAALPNGAASINATGWDLELGAQGDFMANAEISINAPALTTGELPNAATMTYIVQHDDAVGFGTATTLIDNALVQTGAGGVGAAAATVQRRLPVDCKRYVRVRATNSGAGNASGKSVAAEILT